MRRLLSITTATLLALSAMPVFAEDAAGDAGATDEATIAADEAACKQELGYTEEQLKIGTFIEYLRRCMGTKAATRRGDVLAAKLQKQREEMVLKGTERFHSRLRGKDPKTLSPLRAKPQATAVRRLPARPSTRTQRATALKRVLQKGGSGSTAQ
ncbi:MAG: hypothetical protein G01um101425_1010 [Candidatus Peregrinibacteria bacterium Gr01-1014_25]|nr:MAG: hypothetical protein G01um101425_1010 [Candidatus Peregrinibacteria bacterium Gr01-1014_25]